MKKILTALAALTALSCSGGEGSPTNDRNGAFGNDPNGLGTTPLPCDVDRVLGTYCRDCHVYEPEARQFGAPMGLASWEQLHEAGVEGAPTFQRVLARAHSQTNPMPPANFQRPTGDDLKLLNDWAARGAPPGDGSTCPGGTPPPPLTGTGGAGGSGVGGSGVGGSGVGGSGVGGSGVGGSGVGGSGVGGSGVGGSGVGGSGVGGSGVGGSGVGGSGGEVNPPPPPSSCTPYRFTARQTAANDKYLVPTRPEVYQCFIFTVPWQEPQQVFSFQPVLDNTKVLHHWLLYSLDTPEADGANYECLGTHPNAQLVAGWAPGTPGYNFPSNVGGELPPPGSSMLLEIHYFNAGVTPGEFDQSGIEVCASPNFRENTATVSWLGNEAIFLAPRADTNVPGLCRPAAQQPITILRSWPHMHQLGHIFDSFITRANGAIEPLLHVEPYDFYNQISYDTPAVINPGDTITTTCVFRNPTDNLVTFGESTFQEMCYNFVWAYPAGALTSAGLLHRNACML